MGDVILLGKGGFVREVDVRGVEDDIHFVLGYGVEIVAAVMEIDDGSSPDNFLTCEAKLTGEELLNFVSNRSFHLCNKPENLQAVIKKDHHYIITAYDD